MNTEDQIELMRTYIATDRQATVASAMELTEEESKVFWPIYQNYRTDIDPVNDRFVKVLQDYADKHLIEILYGSQENWKRMEGIETENNKTEPAKTGSQLKEENINE